MLFTVVLPMLIGFVGTTFILLRLNSGPSSAEARIERQKYFAENLRLLAKRHFELPVVEENYRFFFLEDLNKYIRKVEKFDKVVCRNALRCVYYFCSSNTSKYEKVIVRIYTSLIEREICAPLVCISNNREIVISPIMTSVYLNMARSRKYDMESYLRTWLQL